MRQCAGWGNLYGGLEPAQTFFSMATQLPIATKAGLPNYNKKYDNGTTADKTLDSLRGKSEAEARQTLESKGYVVKTSRVIGGNVPYGRVVRAITGKDGKKKGAEITLQLSDGAGASQSPSSGVADANSTGAQNSTGGDNADGATSPGRSTGGTGGGTGNGGGFSPEDFGIRQEDIDNFANDVRSLLGR